MDEGMLDGKSTMTKFVNLISSEPDIAKVNRDIAWRCAWYVGCELCSVLSNLLSVTLSFLYLLAYPHVGSCW